MKERHWVLQESDQQDPDTFIISWLVFQDELLHGSRSDISPDAVQFGKNIIPVGELSFVENWLKKSYGKQIVPIEVPVCLRKQEFLGRSYQILDRDQLPYEDGTLRFVKNISRPNAFEFSLYEGRVPAPSTLPEGKYLVSGWVSILSEFRVFVFRDEILAARYNTGNPLVFPDTAKVRRMVQTYADQDSTRPGAYVMDVAVIKVRDNILDTIILNVHPFVSCGLCGFEDPVILDMLEAGIRYYIET